MDRPEASSIPVTPGVYLYKDPEGQVVYVGKARCLRRRVSSYFRDASRLTPKTRAMIAHAATLDTISTVTEKEALLLESSLIKRYRPRYNILLKDDKQYVLFRLDAGGDWPRLEIVRRKTDDGARYYGPFSDARSARETWDAVYRMFPMRRCSDRAMRGRTRPCLYHDMGRCPAPCVGAVSREEYAATVGKAELFLSGRSRELADMLSAEMSAASEAMEYERAAVLRDRLRAVRATVERQSVVLGNGGDMDVAAVAPTGDGLGLGLLRVRDGRLTEGRRFHWPGLGVEDASELLWSFLGQFYADAAGQVPPLLVVPDIGRGTAGDDEDGDEVAREALEALLSDACGVMASVRPPRGDAERGLADMAVANAREAAAGRADAMGFRLARLFGREAPLRTVACVDVSHTGGGQTRVGVVVFRDGDPLRSAYRTYALEGTHGDDHAALSAWAGRYAARRTDGGEEWPDLVLVDGGRGQVATVARAFAAAGAAAGKAFLLAGIAKARGEDGRADRRAGNVSDRVFPMGEGDPLPLRAGAPELLYLQRIRDEAHRFAVGRHRLARGRASLAGTLLSVPGVGPATARRLWDAFGDASAIAAATEERLAAVPGIGPRRAALLAERLSALRR